MIPPSQADVENAKECDGSNGEHKGEVKAYPNGHGENFYLCDAHKGAAPKQNDGGDVSSASLGFQSGQKSTTAERSEEELKNELKLWKFKGASGKEYSSNALSAESAKETITDNGGKIWKVLPEDLNTLKLQNALENSSDWASRCLACGTLSNSKWTGQCKSGCGARYEGLENGSRVPEKRNNKGDKGLQNAQLDDMIAMVRSKLGGRDTLPSDAADKLLDIIHSADDAAIMRCLQENIKFVTPLARNEANRRGLLKNSGHTTNDGKTLDDISKELTGKPYRQLPDDGPAQEEVMRAFESKGGVAQQAFKNSETPKDLEAFKAWFKENLPHTSFPDPGTSQFSTLLKEFREKTGEKRNAGHLGPETWLASSTDERAEWLSEAGADINLSTKESWDDLSEDVKIGLQDVIDKPASQNNETMLENPERGGHNGVADDGGAGNLENSSPNEVNPRYLEYCKTEGLTPEEMMKKDEKRYPGGKMAGFLGWATKNPAPKQNESSHPFERKNEGVKRGASRYGATPPAKKL